MLAASAIEIIGGTPLIALDRIYTGPGRIIAKAEFLLPGGSVKDRAAKALLLAAREDGRLKPGMPVVEMTSGNMGAGLAVACAALGPPLVHTVTASNIPAHPKILEGLAAGVVRHTPLDAGRGNDERKHGRRTGGGMRRARPSPRRHDVGRQQSGASEDARRTRRRSGAHRPGGWKPGPGDGFRCQCCRTGGLRDRPGA